MNKQLTYGVFDTEADHLIELVRCHTPLEQVRAAGCPSCGAAILVTFAKNGHGFTISCEGKFLHMSPYQEIAQPPPWWHECVVEPTNLTWHWREWHYFDAAGNLTMKVSGWAADGARWSGQLECPTNHPDYSFWQWVLLESGCTSELIDDTELAHLRCRFAKIAEPTDGPDNGGV